MQSISFVLEPEKGATSSLTLIRIKSPMKVFNQNLKRCLEEWIMLSLTEPL